MLSPSNTVADLTTDDDLYPTGTRSFFRIAAKDDLDGTAQVELVKKLGHDRVYLLTSELQEYPDFVEGAREAAKRLDVEIVGQAVFDHEAEIFAGLAREIAKKRPEAVAIAAVLSEGAGEVVASSTRRSAPTFPSLRPTAFA